MKKIVFLSMFIILFFGSCQIGYVPTVVNSPLFEKKNQFSATASILSNVDVQTAYSISNKLYIHGDGSYLLPNDEGTDGLSFSTGLGYYKLGDNNNIFEFAGGIGAGNTEDLYTKLYLQPTFGWKKKYNEIGFTSRAVLVNYPELNDGTSTTSATDIFIEPVGNFRFGKGKAKFQMQIGLSLPVRYSSDVGYIPFVMGFGMHYRM